MKNNISLSLAEKIKIVAKLYPLFVVLLIPEIIVIAFFSPSSSHDLNIRLIGVSGFDGQILS